MRGRAQLSEADLTSHSLTEWEERIAGMARVRHR